MRTAVVFDLEDTLVQTPWSEGNHVAEFRKATRTTLNRLGIPQAMLEGTERSTIMRNRAADYVQTHFNSAQKMAFNHDLGEFLRAYELEAARGSKLFPDTVSVLERLKTQCLPIGLVTNTSREAADIEFKLHRIGEYFKSVVTRERVTKLKPDPEGILLAANELDATRIFMVGDLRIDLEAAKAANATSIIVRRSHGDADNLNPDHYVASLNEIPAIVDKYLR